MNFSILSIWGAAKYEDDYLRVGGEWKFKRVKLISLMWAPVEQGWEKQRIFRPERARQIEAKGYDGLG